MKRALLTASPERLAALRHIAGFLISGTLAFLTDVGVTKLVGALTAWPWGICRLIAMPPSMLVAWACHRRLTFAVQVPPSLLEFTRYVTMAWSAALLNYLLFLGVLWLRTGTDPAVAIGVSSLVAMAYSYLAMRFGVFTKR
jgi:putative flippase GtrA